MISLRRRLILGEVVALVPLVAAAVLYAGHRIQSRLTSQFDAALVSKAAALATLVEGSAASPSFRFADENLPEYSRSRDPEYFQIWLPDGTTLEGSRSLAGKDLPRRADLGVAPAIWDIALPDGRPGRITEFRFLPQGPSEGETERVPESADPAAKDPTLAIAVASEREDLDHATRDVWVTLLAIGTGLLAAVVLATLYVVRRGLAPLQAISDRVAAIGPDDLAARLPGADTPAEARSLVDRLNELLTRIQDAFEREHRFTADAAHELRTPIAELRTASEVALRWPDDPAAARHGLETAEQVARRMARLVDALLLLTRCESGTQELRLEPMDLATTLQEVWRGAEARVRERELDAALDAPAGITIMTDPSLLRSLVSNVIENAVEHASEQGRIEVRVSQAEGEVSILCANTCRGLDPADVDRMFDRFWRKSADRSGSSHAGLGLALVREIARVLGGTVTASLPTRDLFVLTLRLPVRRPAGP